MTELLIAPGRELSYILLSGILLCYLNTLTELLITPGRELSYILLSGILLCYINTLMNY